MPKTPKPRGSEVDDRVLALQASGLLDSPPDAAFDRLTLLVQRLLDVPVSLVSFVDTERQFFKSAQGLAEPWCSLRETPLSHSFCQHVVESSETLVVENAREHPLVAHNPAIRDLNVQAYLGVPVRTPEGQVIGSLCAIDSTPRSWSAKDKETLTTLAEITTSEIASQFRLMQLRDAQRSYQASEQRVRDIIDHMAAFVGMLTPEGVLTEVNQSALDAALLEREAVLGKPFPETYWWSYDKEVQQTLRDAIARARAGETVRFDTHARVAGGELIAIDCMLTPILNGAGKVVSLIPSAIDITQRKRAEEDLKAQAARLSLALDAGNMGSFEWHLGSDEVVFNEVALAMTDLTDISPVTADVFFARVHAEDLNTMQSKLADAQTSGGVYMQDFRFSQSDSSQRWLAARGKFSYEEGQAASFIGVIHDVTVQKQMTKQLTQMAFQDALTGLPNRVHLHRHLKQLISQARREGFQFAVMFIDLDNFKVLNDSLGHAFGDHVLRHVADTLRAAVRTEDVVVRLGGDEFVVVLNKVGGAKDAGVVARKLTEVLSRPFTIGEQEVRSAPSIGISLFQGEETLGDLLKHADLAMYQAKERGKGTFHFFTPRLNEQVQARLQLEHDLHRALENREIEVYYQPRFDLRSNHAKGVEALVRWQHPERGLLLPAQFISVAEETGLIHPLGRFVLEQACTQTALWVERGIALETVAVNISVKQLQHPTFIGDVQTILQNAALEPRLLEFEITESTMMNLDQHNVDLLTSVKALGIQLAVDDFGTGYSSLAYLQRLPLDILKVDRRFVQDIQGGAQSKATAIVRAITALGKELGLKLIGEGVETPEQRRFISEAGCTEGQGFLFSRALPAAKLAPILQGPNRFYA